MVELYSMWIYVSKKKSRLMSQSRSINMVRACWAKGILPRFWHNKQVRQRKFPEWKNVAIPVIVIFTLLTVTTKIDMILTISKSAFAFIWLNASTHLNHERSIITHIWYLRELRFREFRKGWDHLGGTCWGWEESPGPLTPTHVSSLRQTGQRPCCVLLQ